MKANHATAYAALVLLALLFRSGAINANAAVDYSAYQTLLDRHLVHHTLPGGGLITAFDYPAALASDDTWRLLDQQRTGLAAFDPSALKQREAALAFWINAYNFFMLEHILTQARSNQLVDSVKDFGSLFNPYRVFSRRLFTVGGRQFSLDEMEKEILLGEDYRERGWWDARVHFAVNCASVGCPPLRRTIYRAETIDRQLDDSTRRALATPRHLQLDDNKLHLSRLFDWYQQDFINQSGSIEAFLRQHLEAERAERMDSVLDIDFIDYDWRLNRVENFPRLSD